MINASESAWLIIPIKQRILILKKIAAEYPAESIQKSEILAQLSRIERDSGISSINAPVM